jgi:SAM-dependent methyltransferase
MTEPSSLEPSIALAAYAEPLASNRRVLVFGNALGSLPLQLLERGARSVHVCDPDALRVSEAAARNRSTQIAFSSLADSDLSLQDGAFDLSLVDNLGAYSPLSLLRTAKRALGPRGVAVVACPNPEAAFPLLRPSNPAAASLDYYALYDAVAAEFEHVRMLGQTPFVGYAIADFSASGEPEPALDTSFVPGGAEEPDVFIALASNQELRLDEFAVIQLPTRRLLSSINAPVAPVSRIAPAPPTENAALTKARDTELVRLNQWIKELESRASTADERADHSEAELETERQKLETERKKFESERQASATLNAQREREISAARAELAKLESERQASATLNAQRERDISAARAELAKFEAERQASAALKAQHEKEISAARAELNALRTQATNLRAEASNKASELDRVTVELAERTHQLAQQAEKLDQGNAAELAEFERQLAERGTEVRRLEQELRTAERTGRELVRELERRTSEQAKQAGLELERALAEREADLQAAAWTIESLSLRLELAGKPAADEGPGPKTASPSEEAR